jgi:hypothetical protein
MTPGAEPFRAREPRPKPLTLAVMIVSVLGGSCTLQSMIAERPSQEQIAQMVEPIAGAQDAEVRARMIRGFDDFAAESQRVASQLQPFHVGFGVFLIACYAFAFLFGLRSLNFARESPRQLALASLLVLVARVAMASVDVAQAQKLRPSIAALAQKAGPAPEPSQVEALRWVANAFGWTTVAFQLALALAVCALFTVSWRYFQRPDVLAYFERKSPPDPLD